MAWEKEETIVAWCDRERKAGKTFMLLCCDRFDYEQFPVGVTETDFWERFDYYQKKEMSSVDAIYDLTQPGTKKLNEYPPRDTEVVRLVVPKTRTKDGRFQVECDPVTGVYRVVK